MPTRPRPARARLLDRDRALGLLCLLAGAPGSVLAVALLFRDDFSPALRWTLSSFCLGVWLALSWAVQRRVTRWLRTLSALLAGIREGDYALRLLPGGQDALGEAVAEANALAMALRGQRFSSIEDAGFMAAVLAEVEVGVFAFDARDRLRLVNRAGAALLGRPEAQLLGLTASALGLFEALSGPSPRVVELVLPEVFGRFEARTREVRREGEPHRVLVLADLRRALREEERTAWQRLVRVLSHEINNSLTPIQSIAESLRSLVARARDAELRADLEEGLRVVAERAHAIGRFLASYAQLARLPSPNLSRLPLRQVVRRVMALQPGASIEAAGPDVAVLADGDQIEQMLINLLRNAVEASGPVAGAVRLEWQLFGPQVELRVLDRGPGVGETANLFVPFFTTKPQGSGIGLVLSRQIAEAHGGSLQLRNRQDGPGAEAVVRLQAA